MYSVLFSMFYGVKEHIIRTSAGEESVGQTVIEHYRRYSYYVSVRLRGEQEGKPGVCGNCENSVYPTPLN